MRQLEPFSTTICKMAKRAIRGAPKHTQVDAPTTTDPDVEDLPTAGEADGGKKSSRSAFIKPDISRFRGFGEPDARAWLENYEVICDSAGIDPGRSFPMYCTDHVLSSLRAKSAVFVNNSWSKLKKLLTENFVKVVSPLKLQNALFNRKQGVDESVSQFADALDMIAIQLGKPMDDYINAFIGGLQPAIADGLKSLELRTFLEALAAARRVEEFNETRKPTAAVPVVTTTGQPMTAMINEASTGEQVPPAILAAITNALQTASTPVQQTGYRPNFKPFNKNRFIGQQRKAPFNRPQRPNQPRTICDFCGYTNHTEDKCSLKLERDRRRASAGYQQGGRPTHSGYLTSMTATYQSSNVTLGPLMTTDEIIIGGAKLVTLIDTGATASFIHKAAVQKLNSFLTLEQLPIQFVGGNGQRIPQEGAIQTVINLLEDNFKANLIVSSAIPFDIVIGTDILEQIGAVINVAQRVLQSATTEKKIALTAPQSSFLTVAVPSEEQDTEEGLELSIAEELTADVLNSTQECSEGSLGNNEGPTVNSQLEKLKQQEIQQILEEYQDVFRPANGAEPCAFPPFEVDTQDSAPVFSQPRRIPYSEREVITKHVQQYLERGWIRPSTSNWSAPTLVVRRNGKERFCVDYRRLNERTVPDRYPSPDVHDCLDKLGQCKYFTLCDADAAYHQCLVAEPHKLAFVTHDGLFEPTVLLFGPRNAPAYFQRNMAAAVQDLEYVQAYMDDIMVATPDWESHVRALEQLFSRMREYNIRFKPSKCRFGMYDVKYLGYHVSQGKIQPEAEKVKSIMQMNHPSSVTELRTFMGLCAYYQPFVEHFADLAAPLYELTRAGTKWHWTATHQQSFEKLKESICKEPVLCLPNFSKEFEIYTDASTVAVGAVLQQRDDNGNPHPVAFASRVLLPAETRYFTQELECLAVIFGLLKFRVYLLGKHFKLFTDHKALLSVLTKQSPSARITRWSLAMQEYDFDIVHIPGSLNKVPDALSRASVMCTIFPTDLSIWKGGQSRDEFCVELVRQILATAADDEEAEIAGFSVTSAGLLVLNSRGAQSRIVVPKEFIPAILEQVHSAPTGAHQGINRTAKLMASSYFWLGWRRDVANYVRGCKTCQQRNNPGHRDLPKMHVHSAGPNDLVAMDTQGPLNTTTEGKQYILVIQDLFTKFVQTVALKDTTAESVAAAFIQHWVTVFGPPNRLLTDNGANFATAWWEDMLTLLKIQKLWTSPYRPQTDGTVERFNRTVTNMISHYVNDYHNNLDQFLPLVTYAYNATFNSVVHQSPYLLMMGRHPPSISDVLGGLPSEQFTKVGGEMRQAMKNALTEAYQHIIRKQRKEQDEVQEQLTGFKPYVKGDEVLILDQGTVPGLKPKFRRRWIGPYVVTVCNGPLSYQVQSKDGLKEYRVHAEHMKRVYALAEPESTSWPQQDLAAFRRSRKQNKQSSKRLKSKVKVGENAEEQDYE